MEKNSNSKEPKRGTIQSFFSSQATKKKKCDDSLISSKLIVIQIIQINTSWSTGEQQEPISPSSSSNQQREQIHSFSIDEQQQPSSSFSSNDQQLQQIHSVSIGQQQELSSSSSNNQQCEQIHSFSIGEQQPSSLFSSNDEQQRIHLFSAGKQQELSSSSFSNNQQPKQIHSSSSESSPFISSSSNIPISNITDISRSADELPAQPILASYPTNKDKRSFRSQWFSQYRWLEYSEQTDLAYCYYCRHFSTGIILNNRVNNFSLIHRFLFQDSILFFKYILKKLIFSLTLV